MSSAPDGPGGEALRVEHVAKRFGGVTALADVNLRLDRGEVLGLIGDNGAGKSTLIKILCGFHQPDAGRIFVGGEEVVLKSVDHARTLGVDTVYQDLALVNELSVYHNMFLNRELVRWPLLSNRRMRRLARQHLEDMGVNIPSVEDEVAKLSGGQRQAIAVARSVYSDARILLLDEPLAAMGAKEGALILDLVRDLKARGDVSVIIIAHNYGQILEVCDRINLLQHGTITFDKPTSQTSVQELTDLVVAEYRAARTAKLRPDPSSNARPASGASARPGGGGPGGGRRHRRPRAGPGPGEVLVEVVAAGICGSDIELLDGRRPAAYVRYPVVPGDEWAGRVLSVGPEVRDLAPGDPVVAEGLAVLRDLRPLRRGAHQPLHGRLRRDRLHPPRRPRRTPGRPRPAGPPAAPGPAAGAGRPARAGRLRGQRPARSRHAPAGHAGRGGRRRAPGSPRPAPAAHRHPRRARARGWPAGPVRLRRRLRRHHGRRRHRPGRPRWHGRSLRRRGRGHQPPRRRGHRPGLAAPRRQCRPARHLRRRAAATIDPDTLTLNQLRVQGGFAASRAAWRWITGLYAQGIIDPAALITHRFALEEVAEAFAALPGGRQRCGQGPGPAWRRPGRPDSGLRSVDWSWPAVVPVTRRVVRDAGRERQFRLPRRHGAGVEVGRGVYDLAIADRPKPSCSSPAGPPAADAIRRPLRG